MNIKSNYRTLLAYTEAKELDAVDNKIDVVASLLSGLRNRRIQDNNQ